MRTRSVSYWISQISAEKEYTSKKTKEPNNTKDLHHYLIAAYLLTRNKSKVA
jgi:hypothetical protein